MKITKKILTCFAFLLSAFLFFSCVSVPEPTTGEEKKRYEEPKKDPKVEFALNLEKALKNGDYEAALSFFENLSEELKNDIRIKNLKLSILISSKKLKEANIYAEELEKDYPEDMDVLYSQVILAQAENNQKKKNIYLEKILRKNPADVRALTEQGSDFYTKRRYNEARRKFLEAYKADSKAVNALIGLARVNYMQQKLDQAESNLNAVLELEEENSFALAELARVKSETNRMYEALNDIKKAIELSPDIANHWMDLASYNLQIGRKEEARTAFGKVIDLEPDSYVAYIYRAGLNDDLGYKEEALKDYIKVCEIYPAYFYAFEGAGILFLEKKDWQNANTAFIKALAKSPESYHYAIIAAFCYHKMNKKFEAKDFMQKYLKTIDRTKKVNEYTMCRLFIDFAGDTEAYNKATMEKDNTKKGRMFFYIALFYELTNKPALAEKCYAEVLSIRNPAFFEYRLAENVMNAKLGKAE